MSENRERMEGQTIGEEEKIDLIAILEEFWYGFKKLWFLMALLVALGAARSYFSTSYSYTPQYVASATMSVTTPAGNGGYMDAESARQMANVFPYILTSGVLQDVVAEEMGLSSIPGSIQVEAEEDTNLLTMSVSSSDAQMAYDILHAVIDNYPRVTEFVFGETTLEILDETGVPTDTGREVVIRGSFRKGAIQGAAAAVVILCLYVLSRQTVKSKDKLKRQINLKDLGSLPLVKKKKRRKKTAAPICLLDERLPASYRESVSRVKMRIWKAMAEKGQKTVLVTSSIPGEGKTTVAVNLALSLAKQGKAAVLVDCDLRNPSVAKVLAGHLPPEGEKAPGLAAVLKGKASLEHALLKVDVSGTSLQVLCGGKGGASDVSLMGSRRMREVVETLKRQADVIILDTAPAELLADAALVARCADAAVYVIRCDYAKMKRIRSGIQALSISNIPILGYVFNSDVSAKEKRYGYGYGYQYGYRRYGAYGRYRDTGKREDEAGRVIKD